ncbi:ATP-binding protein [Mesorhizobium sp. LNJC394B00]|uniref:ATP-binding protein n=1 Tax=Mesorhizobium sp. LNJC394B00 TaxID=1287274 RepID=UPI002474C6AE|nr:ATP-binding protein [Mesorhizobium sp. LNJC394B00]
MPATSATRCRRACCRRRRERDAGRQTGHREFHIAKAIAYQAILHSHKVQYLETDDFLHRHALNAPAQREARMRTIIDCDLHVLDDLLLADAGAWLQILIHQRYKLPRSVVVTSNRVVQDWGTYLRDNVMSTTILDRLMHHLPGGI